MDISLDSAEPVLVLRYQVDGGKTTTQRVKVRKLKPDTNVPLLANKLSKQTGIPAYQVATVELLLYQLQARENGGGHQLSKHPSFGDRDLGGLSSAQHDVQRMLQQEAAGNNAKLEDLQDYIASLYDDKVAEKIKGANHIAQLFNNLDNYDALLSQDTLVPTLSRILRDDGKLANNLCVALLRVLFCLSCFSQFHTLLVDNTVGALTFEILDLEFKRAQRRLQEEKLSLAALGDLQRQAAEGRRQLSAKESAFVAFVEQQDRLMYLAFYLLLNLAEDVEIEKKMRKKNILAYLLGAMDRTNTELLTVLVTFLKKLSVHDDCKLAIATPAFVTRLNTLLYSPDDTLVLAVLRLIYNLSFDVAVRRQMIKLGMIPRMVDLLQQQNNVPLVLGVLYHMSMEVQHMTAFVASGCVPKLFDMLIRARKLADVPQLVALLLNLSNDATVIQEVHKHRLVPSMISRALSSKDPLLLKVVHHISAQPDNSIKACFKAHYEKLVQLMQEAANTNTDVFVEVLSILSNLYFPEFDFLTMVKKHNLLAFLKQILQQCYEGFVEEDVLLEVIGLLGSICHQTGTADLIVESGLGQEVVQLVLDKGKDTIYQSVLAFTCHQMLLFDATRKLLLAQPEVLTFLIDVWAHGEPAVQEAVDAALDAVVASDPATWEVKVKTLKFEQYNREWLRALKTQQQSKDGWRARSPGPEGTNRIQTFMDFKGMSIAG